MSKTSLLLLDPFRDKLSAKKNRQGLKSQEVWGQRGAIHCYHQKRFGGQREVIHCYLQRRFGDRERLYTVITREGLGTERGCTLLSPEEVWGQREAIHCYHQRRLGTEEG